jgi:hypothetical protein
MNYTPDVEPIPVPKGTIVLGIDTETIPSKRSGRPNPVCLLQIASLRTACLFRISPAVPLPSQIVDLLHHPRVVVVGQNAQVDLDEIWWATPKLMPTTIIELSHEIPAVGCRCRGIPGYVAAFLGTRVSKKEQMSNWEADSLTRSQQQCAAMDAFTARAAYVATGPNALQQAKERRPQFFGDPPGRLNKTSNKIAALTKFPLPGVPLHKRNTWELLASMDKDKVPKWARLLYLDTVNTSDAPHMLVTTASDLLQGLNSLHSPPLWVVVDGGCFHSTTKAAIKARGYYLWGAHFSILIWTLQLNNDHVSPIYQSLEALASALRKASQKQIMKSYYSVGSARFKIGYCDGDFAMDKVAGVLHNPATSDCGYAAKSKWKMACTRHCPQEPATVALPLHDNQLLGYECQNVLSKEQAEERRLDLLLWKKQGQLWIDAFPGPARKRAQTFLNDNAQANAAVARAAQAWESSPHPSPFTFGEVDDLVVTQEELRPGARGILWEWRDGTCTTTTPETASNKVVFNVKNVTEAYRLVNFRDNRALQMLTITGSSHMTKNFPLHCLASRNHQGAAKFPHTITKLILDKIASGHVVKVSGDAMSSPHPPTIPFCVLPVNGSLANLKEDQHFNKEQGEPYKPNVRPTFDGSSPHDESGLGINDHTVLPPELDTQWATGAQVEESLRVLLFIGALVLAFKLDLEKSYFQIWHQNTQLWRQHFYHDYIHMGVRHAGYMASNRCLWGFASSAAVFHRSITTITVKYVERCLLLEWVPTMQCPKVKTMDGRQENRRHATTGCSSGLH